MKYCPKCKTKKPSTEFYKNLVTKDGLRSWCKLCCNEDNNKREPKYRKYREQYRQSKHGKELSKQRILKYYNTIKGHLRQVFSDIKRRCNNPDCKSFKDYGGRGIQNKFLSLNDFRNYVTSILKIDPRELQIDRINNNGHYEKGNIRFVTAKENLENRGR